MASKKELIKVKDIGGVLCGWAGCKTSAEFDGPGPDSLLPEGWRALVVSKYSLLDAGVLHAEVDMMLCPDHVASLRRQLRSFDFEAAGIKIEP